MNKKCKPCTGCNRPVNTEKMSKNQPFQYCEKCVDFHCGNSDKEFEENQGD